MEHLGDGRRVVAEINKEVLIGEEMFVVHIDIRVEGQDPYELDGEVGNKIGMVQGSQLGQPTAYTAIPYRVRCTSSGDLAELW